MFCMSLLLFLSCAQYFVNIQQMYVFIALLFLISSYYLLKGRLFAGIVIAKKIIFISLLFIGVLLIAVSYSRAPEYGSLKATFFSIYLVTFLLGAKIINKQFHFFTVINIVLGLVLLAFVIKEFKDPISYMREMSVQNVRLGVNASTGENSINPIWLSRYLGFVFIIMVFFWNAKGVLFNIVKYICVLMAGLYMVTSGSKGPIVGMALGFFLSYFNWKNIWRTIGKSIIVLVGIVGLVFALGLQKNEFLMKRFAIDEGGDSFSSRETLIDKIKGNIALDNAILGNGTGDAGYMLTGADERMYPHNIIIELLYENGIIGFLLFALLMIDGGRYIKYRALSKPIRFWMLLFIYFLFNAMVSGDLMSNQFIFFAYFNLISCFAIFHQSIKGYAEFKIHNN